MSKKLFKEIALSALIASLPFSLLQTGCSNKNNAGNQNIQNQNENTADANALSCPTGAFRIVNTQNQDTTAPTAKSLYPQYVGHYNGYVTSVASLNDGGAVFSVRNSEGSTLSFAKNGIDSGQSLDVKSPVRSMKVAKLGDSLTLLVGTVSNFQQIPLNASNGAPSGASIAFDALGGVNSITTLGNDIYVATLAGDVAKIPSSTVSTQGGCATVAYSASANVETSLNRPMKAFRVQSAGDKVFIATRNYGISTGTVNDLMEFMYDFNFSKPNFLKWKTQISSFNPSNGQVANLPTQLANRKLTLLQDLTGDGKSVFSPFVAYVDRDVDQLNTCLASSSCNAKDWLAFLLNATSGLSAYQGEELVASLQVPPSLSTSDELGCPASTLLTSCIRLPNFGMFYTNVAGASDNTVVMRGIWGYAEVDHTDQISASSTLRVKNLFTAPLTPTNRVNFGIPYQGTGIPQGLESAGFFIKLIPGGGCGGIMCGYEKGQLTAGPTLTLNSSLGNRLFHGWSYMTLGATHSSAYFSSSSAGKEFKRINLADGADKTEFDSIPGYSPSGSFIATRERDSGADRLAALFDDGSGKYVLAAYDSNSATAHPSAAALDLSALPSPNHLAAIFPLQMEDNLAVAPISYDTGGGAYKYQLLWASLSAWPTPGNLTATVDLGANYILATRNLEKTADPSGKQYKLYMLAGDPSSPTPMDSLNVKTLTFNYDGSGAPTDFVEKSFVVSDLKGFDAYQGSIYVVKKNGDIVKFSETGSVEKTYTNALNLAAGQTVGFSTLNVRSGNFVAAAFVSGSPTAHGGMKTIIKDPNSDAPGTNYELNPYFFAHVSKSKILMGSSILGSNGTEAFDLAKAVTAPNIVTGGAPSPEPAPSPAPAPGVGGGVNADGTPIVKVAPGTSDTSCSLNLLAGSGSAFSYFLLLAGLAPLAAERLRKRS